MRKKLLLLAAVVSSVTALSQDFSNKGKDFYLCFPNHVPVNLNSLATLSIYITSDQASSGTVTMANGAFSATFNIVADAMQEIQIPASIGEILNTESGMIIQKSIRVKVDPGKAAVVVFAQLWAGARSAATLVLPTNVLGKKYYAVSYTQTASNTGTYIAKSQFHIIAIDSNTVVRVTPKANGVAGTPFTITFSNPGDMYQYQADQDVTGTYVESIASGTSGCKPIAVFSGSSTLTMGIQGCNSGGTVDPLFQQLYPVSTWGKNFGFIPFASYPAGNPYRVMASEDNTNVYFDGLLVATLNTGDIYPNTYNSNPVVLTVPTNISADKPICVAQYAQRAACAGNGTSSTLGDDDMVILNPIEQNIQRITVFSSTNQAISQQWVNVLLKTVATPGFTINGNPPLTPWTAIPTMPGYSYLREPFPGAGSYLLNADSGFNAIAYGWGQVESYVYSAGTSVRDLYTFVSPLNPLNITNENTACAGTPFYFAVTYPYQPLSLYWDFHGYQSPNVTVNSPVPDTTYLINGTQVWRYKISSPSYTYSPAGSYPISITAQSTGSDSCGSFQTRDDSLYVYNPSQANFSWQNNGCVTDSVSFNDSTNYAFNVFSYQWWWDFGDGSFGNTRNPKHKYALPGTYTVRFSITTNVGCLSDTASRQITITLIPDAKFGISNPVCDGMPVIFSDSSIAYAPGSLMKWYWDYGDGIKDTVLNGSNRIHTYTPWGNKTATLKVETNSGCQSTFFNKTFYVGPIPLVDFVLPAGVCLPVDSAHFFDASTIADGSQAGFIYKWNFGDIPSGINDSSVLKNPAHYYTNTGPFNINLQVTSNVGCGHDTTKALINIYPQAHANFSVNPENCLRDSTAFTSNATGSGSTIVEWHWDFGDGNFSTLQNPKHVYATVGVKTIKHWIVTDKGCYSDTTTMSILINPLPTAGFNYSPPSCETKTIGFTDASAPNAGILTNWLWDFGDPSSGAANSSTQQNPTHVFANAGTYMVRLIATSSKGCVSDTFTRPVIINPQPKPGFISPKVCLSDAFAQFIDTSHIATGMIVSWLWNFGDPASGPLNTSNSQNPQHRYNAIGFYTATLTVTSDSGCVATLAQTFTVNGDIPVANFNPLNPATLCANDSVAIQDASTVNFGNVTKVEIYWDNVGFPGVVQIDNNPYPGKIYRHLYPNFQSPPTKTFDILYYAYSGATCVNNKTKTIVVNAAPKVQFNPLPSICLDATPYQITQASEIGGVPGTFVFTGPGVSPTGLFNPAVAGPGTHTIHYAYTSSTGGCVDTASQPITVWDPPVANFNFSGPDCEQVAVTFSDSSSNTVGTLTTWTWDFADGTPVQVNNNNIPFVHTFNSTGTYNVTLQVTTSNGCKSTVKLKPVVVSPQPRPDFTIPSSVCLPAAFVVFNNTSTIADGTENAFTYLWDLGDPPSGVADTSTAKNASHTYYTTGPFNIHLRVTSKYFCIHDTTIVLNTVHPQPKADFKTDKQSVCIGNVITFTDSSNALDGTATQWYWRYGDGSSDSSSPVVIHAYPDTITYYASLYIINSNGCYSDTMTKPFTVYPYPLVNAGPDSYVLENESIILQGVASGNDLQYRWTPNIYLDNNLVPTPKASNLLNDVTYTLTVTARGGCQKSDDVFIKLLKAPRIPNTFTPNGDAVNEKWVIAYLNFYPNNRVQVFTRTGQLVFESHGFYEPWDGTYKGKPLPFDTYYYIIEPGNGRAPITGYVTIVK